MNAIGDWWYCASVASVVYKNTGLNKLRQYDIVEKLSVQDWTVELRKRMQGAHAGDIYLVFVEKNGRQHYTLTHVSSCFFSVGCHKLVT